MYSILDLIPQRPPMVMVDTLQMVSETAAETVFEVLPTNIFCQDGALQPTALMENIAQTAAAHAGYWAKEQNAPPGIGFIGAIKDFKCHRCPNVGEVLHTKIQVVSNILNFTLIKGEVFIQSECIAEAELKIFIPAAELESKAP